MSVLTVTSVVVAALALGVVAVLAVALLRTRRRLDELQSSVQRLQEAPAPPPRAEVAVRPTQVETPAVVVPSSEQVRRAAMAQPVVRAVALSYGLRRALRPESRDRVAAMVRREFRRRRKVRVRAGRRAARFARVDGAS